MQPRSRRAATHLAQGLLMGGADVVPGVSGGTVALVVGIYHRLIAAIRSLADIPVRLVQRRPREARVAAATADWALLLPLGAGIAVALAVGSLVIPELLERYPVQMLALFLGLVAASVPIPWRRIDRIAPGHLVVVAAAAAVAFLLVGLPPAAGFEPAMPQVFGAAAVAICAMILPGVSGAFLLKAMGVYEVTLGAVRELDALYVGVFVLGAAVGLGVFSRVLGRLLDRHHDVTMAALVGLMVGALRALWPWQADDRTLLAPTTDGVAVAAVLLAAGGFAAVTLLTRLGSRQPEDASLT